MTRARLRTLANSLRVIQLDAVNVLERTQFLVPFSRLGAYDGALLHELGGPGGEVFEYWGHAASLLPTAHHPLFRWRMDEHARLDGDSAWAVRRRRFREGNARYIASILAEVRDRGPLAASQLNDPRRRDGTWWDRRSVGRQVLEHLFASGELAGWRAPNFERIYDVPERVIPAAVLALPTPAVADAQRALVLHAVEAQGIATAADAASYYGLPVKKVQARARELVEAGTLAEVAVDGWRDHAYSDRGPSPPAGPPHPRHVALAVRLDDLGPCPRAPDVRLRVPHRDLHARAATHVRLLRVTAAPRRRARQPLRHQGGSRAVGVARGGSFAEPGVDRARVTAAAAVEPARARGLARLGDRHDRAPRQPGHRVTEAPPDDRDPRTVSREP